MGPQVALAKAVQNMGTFKFGKIPTQTGKNNKNEYDYLPVLEPEENKNPLILVDQKLGLHLWAVRVLYSYAYKKLFNLRERKIKLSQDVTELVHLTRAVLLLNPDCMTAWNIRKELVTLGDIDALDDRKLANLVLTKHPKSPETFAHRKWLLNKLSDQYAHGMNANLNSSVRCKASIAAESYHTPGGAASNNVTDGNIPQKRQLRALLSQEMHVCHCAADKYPNNYNAWTHRIWVLQHWAQNDKKMLENELSENRKFICSHVSDHSGFHYRQFLLSSLDTRLPSSAYIDLLSRELELNKDLIISYTGHQALWYHRRFCLQALVEKSQYTAVLVADTTPDAISVSTTCKRSRLELNPESVCLQEEDFCCRLSQKPGSQWQLTLLQKHSFWIEKCLNVTVSKGSCAVPEGSRISRANMYDVAL